MDDDDLHEYARKDVKDHGGDFEVKIFSLHYVRAGKHLPARVTEICVELEYPPQAVFAGTMTNSANYLRFRLGPEVQIAMGVFAKTPGEEMTEPCRIISLPRAH